MAMFVALLLGGCVTSSVDKGAFDFESGSIGKVDSKGFPVLSGGAYQRDVPLKRSLERAQLEAELQALAESQASGGANIDQRRSALLQQRLRQIALTHGAKAEAEIAAACTTDSQGIVTCNTD